ncbi:MAG: hypothetical protein II180_07365, partial [Proteobacteria bacterium]|nr:hypothetical protein [Pseudomonadota bacterium]
KFNNQPKFNNQSKFNNQHPQKIPTTSTLSFFRKGVWGKPILWAPKKGFPPQKIPHKIMK